MRKKSQDRMARSVRDRDEEKPPLEPVDRPKQESRPVHPVVLSDRVPPQSCPTCGRGMDPRVHRTYRDMQNPYADCECRLCGKRFRYQYPRVIPRKQ